MRIKKNTYFSLIFIVFTLISCNKSNEESLEEILNSEYLEIQINGYGGLAGYFEERFYVKKKEFESIIIVNKGTDYQTFVRIEDDRKLLKEFINESFKTNTPKKKIMSSCIGGIDYEYIFKSGLTELTLKPNRKCDSLFDVIMKYK